MFTCVVMFMQAPVEVSGDDFDGYQVFIQPAPPGAAGVYDVAKSETNFFIPGLAFFTTYSFQVALYNSEGAGPRTEPIHLTTPSGGTVYNDMSSCVRSVVCSSLYCT